MYTYIHLHRYTDTHIHICTYTQICRYTDTHIHRYTYTYTHTHIDMYVYIYIYIHVYTHIYTYAGGSMFVLPKLGHRGCLILQSVTGAGCDGFVGTLDSR